MSRKLVLCVVANDAEKCNGKYVRAGPNYRHRLSEFVSDYPGYHDCPHIWAFGAGTDAAHAGGPTLASLCEKELANYLPDIRCLTNIADRTYYGTYEELFWITRAVRRERLGDVRFVLCTQRDHMPRVRLIWRLFFAKEFGDPIFFETEYAPGHELDLRDEFKKQLKICLLWLGRGCWLIRPRFVRENY